jgi:hypothetical protein
MFEDLSQDVRCAWRSLRRTAVCRSGCSDSLVTFDTVSTCAETQKLPSPLPGRSQTRSIQQP